MLRHGGCDQARAREGAGKQLLWVFSAPREPKIADFQITFFSEQDVSWLQITVNDAARMSEGEAWQGREGLRGRLDGGAAAVHRESLPIPLSNWYKNQRTWARVRHCEASLIKSCMSVSIFSMIMNSSSKVSAVALVVSHRTSFEPRWVTSHLGS